MEKGGAIKAIVVGVGGFLGVGEHLVALPLDKVKFVNEPVASTSTQHGRAPAPPARRPRQAPRHAAQRRSRTPGIRITP